MENGQKHSIPLDSALDINSGDQLVPVSQPLFSFNRQRLLGSVLQNSVRWEQDGWFAGWWVHNFDLVSTGYINVEPAGVLELPMILKKTIDAENYYWNAIFRETDVRVSFSTKQYENWSFGSGTITRTDGQTVIIVGQTSKGNSFTAALDAYTGAVKTFTADDSSLQAIGRYDGSMFSLEVKRPVVIGADYIHVRFGKSYKMSEDITFAYNFDGTSHTWGDLFSYDGTTFAVTNPAYQLVSWTLNDPGTLVEKLHVVFDSVSNFTLTTDMRYDLNAALDSFVDIINGGADPSLYTYLVDGMNSSGNSATGVDEVNRERGELIRCTPMFPLMTIDAKEMFLWYLPCWIKIQGSINVRFELDVGLRHPQRRTQTGTDPVSGAPVFDYQDKPSWFECNVFVVFSFADASASFQNFKDISASTRWFITFKGVTYWADTTSGEIRIKVNADGPYRDGMVDSRTLAAAGADYDVLFKYGCVNTDPDPSYPVYLGYNWVTASAVAHVKLGQYTNGDISSLPQPPPRYLPWGTAAYSGYPPATFTVPEPPWPAAPSDWSNPVSFPIPWPARPAEWQNPIPWNSLAWPTTQPAGWANPVAWNSLSWPSTPPTDWPTAAAGADPADVVPWPPTWPVGITTQPPASIWPLSWVQHFTIPNPTPPPADIPDPDNPDITHTVQSYADYIAGIAKPTNWPVTITNWPITPEAGYNVLVSGAVNTVQPNAWIPPWPPAAPFAWPFGVTGLPANEWFGTGTFNAWLAAQTKPTNWPVTMVWPVTPEAGYTPRLPNGIVNPTQADKWIPPWPPNWLFGVIGLDALTPTEWFMTPAYNNWIQPLRDANWPPTMAVPGWPIVPEAGYRVRTTPTWPSTPGTLNTTAPNVWKPVWIGTMYPYGITTPPPFWYSATPYLTFIATRPARAASGSEAAYTYNPGWRWYLPSAGAYGRAYPVDTTGYNVYTQYQESAYYPFVAANNKWTLNKTWPDNWPYYVTLTVAADIETKPDFQFGPDYNYHVVLNRPSLFYDDPHMTKVTTGENNQNTINTIVPYCVRAYTVLEAITDDIVACSGGEAKKEAFSLRQVSNAEIGRNYWRNDYDGAAVAQPTKGYTLDAITADYSGAGLYTPGGAVVLPAHGIPTPNYLRVKFNNSSNLNFDACTNWQSVLYEGMDPGSMPAPPEGNVQSYVSAALRKSHGFAPLWIWPDSDVNVWKTWNTTTNYQYNLLLMIMSYDWVVGDTTADDKKIASIESPTNTKLKRNLLGKLTNETPIVSGQFTQVIKYDLGGGSYILITRPISSKSQSEFTIDTSNIAPWTFSSIAFDFEGKKITLVISQSIRFETDLYHAFIFEKMGLMIAVTGITVANKDMIQLAPTQYGIIRPGTLDISGIQNPPVEAVRVDTGTYNDYIVHVSISNKAAVRYLPLGIWAKNGDFGYISIASSGDNHILTFTYKGDQYTLTFDKNVSAILDYNVTDIRNEKIKSLWKQRVNDVKMVVKQFWSNTVDVENFWWIDEDHVLELSKYYLTLYKKSTDANGKYLLHDWNGDRWEIEKQGPRGNFIGSDSDVADSNYGVSSAFGPMRPFFYKLRNMETAINICLIDIMEIADFTVRPQWFTTNIRIEKVDLSDSNQYPSTSTPSALATDAISSPVEIDINALLTTARISSTVVSWEPNGTNTAGTFMLGFAQTRGMNQWVVIFDILTNGVIEFRKVHNGYGHVGIDGTLTGGQYPSINCGSNGFEGVMTRLEDFKDSEGSGPHGIGGDTIYCSGNSLWFVYEELKEITSHYIYDRAATKHVKVDIPLCCNYSQDYELMAYRNVVLQDSIPIGLTIPEIIGMTDTTDPTGAAQLLNVFAMVGLPTLWHMTPTISAGMLLAMGIQQCAYVVRNRLPQKSDDGKSDKDITVRRYNTQFSWSLDLQRYSKMIIFILTIVGAITDFATDDLAVNASTGQNAVKDTDGRVLGDFAIAAAMRGIGAAASTNGLLIGCNGGIEERISLSMFYGIDDGCECWATPGTVNHNFIGQAISQGSMVNRLNIKRFGIFIPLKFLAYATMMATYQILKLVQMGLMRGADAIAGYNPGATVVGTGPSGLPIGSLIATGLNAGAAGLGKVILLYEFMIEKGIDIMYDMLGDKPRGFNSGGLFRNAVQVEATHTYGDKPMNFFYPCFGVDGANDDVMVERVESEITAEGRIDAGLQASMIQVEILSKGFIAIESPANTTPPATHKSYIEGKKKNDGFWLKAGGAFDFTFTGAIALIAGSIKATAEAKPIPQDYVLVEGIRSMLPTDGLLSNLQMNCCNYTFTMPPIHDYIINKDFGIGVVAANGEIISYSCDDVKLMDGPASNIVVKGKAFCGIASSYIAMEIKDGLDMDYLRPWAITPDTIALNITGVNVVHNAKAYHGFDGQFNRITTWKGGSGLDSATLVQQYAFIINDHFKRSNLPPASDFFGKFNGPPSLALKAFNNERLANQVMDTTRQKGLDINIPGEDRDLQRYSVPIHCEQLATLPAMVRMLAPYKLNVVEGVTSLTTDVRSTQTAYKAPSSIDFPLYDKAYRATEEYVCSITTQDGVVALEDKTPVAGLTFIGATTREAFFYSAATRMYYSFSGGQDITKKDIFNRFKDIKTGRWDFVNQEVMFKALFVENKPILVDDVGGYTALRMDNGKVVGEVQPPNETIYNERSDFKILSMPGGMVYQGPKRCAVNRFVILDDMYDLIKKNKRKWAKLDRELWAPMRDYKWHYDDWHTEAGLNAVWGWTHNPWRAATAMLGIDEETDCIFEWEITFAWTEQIDKLFEQNEFISFNLAGETIGQGGKLLSRPSHIFLYRELFKTGYYTMQYQSKNGIGNRERLYMWGDGLMAVEGLSVYTKDITKRRAQPLSTSQVDVQELVEQ